MYDRHWLTASLDELAIGRKEFSTLLGVTYSCAKDWYAGNTKIPQTVIVLVRLMLDSKATLAEVRRFAAEKEAVPA